VLAAQGSNFQLVKGPQNRV